MEVIKSSVELVNPMSYEEALNIISEYVEVE